MLHQQHFYATHTLEVLSSSHTTINLLFGRTRRSGRRFWIVSAVTVLTLDEGVGLAVNDRLWIFGMLFLFSTWCFSEFVLHVSPRGFVWVREPVWAEYRYYRFGHSVSLLRVESFSKNAVFTSCASFRAVSLSRRLMMLGLRGESKLVAILIIR
jgi:hypothetical protein